MTPDFRLKQLLRSGFYPVELPPVFRTIRFDDVVGSFSPSTGYSGSTTFFDGATFKGHLRTFGVVNPVSYFLLSKFISEKWDSIESVYDLSSSSGSRPSFSTTSDGRAVEVNNLATKRRSQQHLAGTYPIIANIDINRFYGSIYTHSIPWAVLGKELAKQLFRRKKLSAHWSNDLDRFVRNCNQQQTIGVPIGPDTSRIVSEIILSRIDKELVDLKLDSEQIYHNIDDYQVGAFDIGDAEDAQSKFVRTISRYELRINDSKSSIDQGLDFAPSNFQRNFDILRGQKGRDFVEHFFELLYSQIKCHPRSNVLGYTVKRFAPMLARNPEHGLVREYLQRLLFAAPFQSRWLLPILLGSYKHHGATPSFGHLLAWGVKISVRRNDVGSLLWFLYALIFMRIPITKELCNQCFGMSNELVDLVLAHGASEDLFEISWPSLRKRYLDSDFSSAAWIVLYEISRKGWDATSAFQKIGGPGDEAGYYKFLSDHKVEFYDLSGEMFSVSAFGGWKLSEDSFVDEDREQEDDWMFYRETVENYE